MKLAYANKGLFPSDRLLLEPRLPLAKPRALKQTWPGSATAPLSPLSRPSVLASCVLPGLSSEVQPAHRSQGKRTSKWEETTAFCFLLQEEKQGYFWPHSVQIRFFFLSFSKPCVWQASGRGVKMRARILNTFAFLLGVSFVCLPLPGCLPRLQIVDCSQTLLSSQRK